MARFYATFDHTTVPSLEARTTGNYYDPRFIGSNSTAGGILKTNLLASQSALSSTIYAQLDDANENGALGVVIPRDAITFSSTNLSWTNAYTTGSAVWQSDPKTRPNTRDILISNSDPSLVAVSPTDSGNVLIGTYNSASAALMAVIGEIRDTGSLTTGNGPYGRLGQNPSRTLFSVWAAHDLSYIGWNDFTPGTPQDIIATATSSTEITGSDYTISIPISWKTEYTADNSGAGLLSATVSDGSNTFTLVSQSVAVGLGTFTWNIFNMPGSTYTLTNVSLCVVDITTNHTGSSRVETNLFSFQMPAI
jgi:hypothetical protein